MGPWRSSRLAALTWLLLFLLLRVGGAYGEEKAEQLKTGINPLPNVLANNPLTQRFQELAASFYARRQNSVDTQSRGIENGNPEGKSVYHIPYLYMVPVKHLAGRHHQETFTRNEPQVSSHQHGQGISQLPDMYHQPPPYNDHPDKFRFGPEHEYPSYYSSEVNPFYGGYLNYPQRQNYYRPWHPNIQRYQQHPGLMNPWDSIRNFDKPPRQSILPYDGSYLSSQTPWSSQSSYELSPHIRDHNSFGLASSSVQKTGVTQTQDQNAAVAPFIEGRLPTVFQGGPKSSLGIAYVLALQKNKQPLGVNGGIKILEANSDSEKYEDKEQSFGTHISGNKRKEMSDSNPIYSPEPGIYVGQKQHHMSHTYTPSSKPHQGISDTKPFQLFEESNPVSGSYASKKQGNKVGANSNTADVIGEAERKKLIGHSTPQQLRNKTKVGSEEKDNRLNDDKPTGSFTQLMIEAIKNGTRPNISHLGSLHKLPPKNPSIGNLLENRPTTSQNNQSNISKPSSDAQTEEGSTSGANTKEPSSSFLQLMTESIKNGTRPNISHLGSLHKLPPKNPSIGNLLENRPTTSQNNQSNISKPSSDAQTGEGSTSGANTKEPSSFLQLMTESIKNGTRPNLSHLSSSHKKPTKTPSVNSRIGNRPPSSQTEVSKITEPPENIQTQGTGNKEEENGVNKQKHTATITQNLTDSIKEGIKPNLSQYGNSHRISAIRPNTKNPSHNVEPSGDIQQHERHSLEKENGINNQKKPVSLMQFMTESIKEGKNPSHSKFGNTNATSANEPLFNRPSTTNTNTIKPSGGNQQEESVKSDTGNGSNEKKKPVTFIEFAIESIKEGKKPSLSNFVKSNATSANKPSFNRPSTTNTNTNKPSGDIQQVRYVFDETGNGSNEKKKPASFVEFAMESIKEGKKPSLSNFGNSNTTSANKPSFNRPSTTNTNTNKPSGDIQQEGSVTGETGNGSNEKKKPASFVEFAMESIKEGKKPSLSNFGNSNTTSANKPSFNRPSTTNTNTNKPSGYIQQEGSVTGETGNGSNEKKKPASFVEFAMESIKEGKKPSLSNFGNSNTTSANKPSFNRPSTTNTNTNKPSGDIQQEGSVTGVNGNVTSEKKKPVSFIEFAIESIKEGKKPSLSNYGNSHGTAAIKLPSNKPSSTNTNSTKPSGVITQEGSVTGETGNVTSEKKKPLSFIEFAIESIKEGKKPSLSNFGNSHGTAAIKLPSNKPSSTNTNTTEPSDDIQQEGSVPGVTGNTTEPLVEITQEGSGTGETGNGTNEKKKPVSFIEFAIESIKEGKKPSLSNYGNSHGTAAIKLPSNKPSSTNTNSTKPSGVITQEGSVTGETGNGTSEKKKPLSFIEFAIESIKEGKKPSLSNFGNSHGTAAIKLPSKKPTSTNTNTTEPSDDIQQEGSVPGVTGNTTEPLVESTQEGSGTGETGNGTNEKKKPVSFIEFAIESIKEGKKPSLSNYGNSHGTAAIKLPSNKPSSTNTNSTKPSGVITQEGSVTGETGNVTSEKKKPLSFIEFAIESIKEGKKPSLSNFGNSHGTAAIKLPSNKPSSTNTNTTEPSDDIQQEGSVPGVTGNTTEPLVEITQEGSGTGETGNGTNEKKKPVSFIEFAIESIKEGKKPSLSNYGNSHGTAAIKLPSNKPSSTNTNSTKPSGVITQEGSVTGETGNGTSEKKKPLSFIEFAIESIKEGKKPSLSNFGNSHGTAAIKLPSKKPTSTNTNTTEPSDDIQQEGSVPGVTGNTTEPLVESTQEGSGTGETGNGTNEKKKPVSFIEFAIESIKEGKKPSLSNYGNSHGTAAIKLPSNKPSSTNTNSTKPSGVITQEGSVTGETGNGTSEKKKPLSFIEFAIESIKEGKKPSLSNFGNSHGTAAIKLPSKKPTSTNTNTTEPSDDIQQEGSVPGVTGNTTEPLVESTQEGSGTGETGNGTNEKKKPVSFIEFAIESIKEGKKPSLSNYGNSHGTAAIKLPSNKPSSTNTNSTKPSGIITQEGSVTGETGNGTSEKKKPLSFIEFAIESIKEGKKPSLSNFGNSHGTAAIKRPSNKPSSTNTNTTEPSDDIQQEGSVPGVTGNTTEPLVESTQEGSGTGETGNGTNEKKKPVSFIEFAIESIKEGKKPSLSNYGNSHGTAAIKLPSNKPSSTNTNSTKPSGVITQEGSVTGETGNGTSEKKKPLSFIEFAIESIKEGKKPSLSNFGNSHGTAAIKLPSNKPSSTNTNTTEQSDNIQHEGSVTGVTGNTTKPSGESQPQGTGSGEDGNVMNNKTTSDSFMQITTDTEKNSTKPTGNVPVFELSVEKPSDFFSSVEPNHTVVDNGEQMNLTETYPNNHFEEQAIDALLQQLQIPTTSQNESKESVRPQLPVTQQPIDVSQTDIQSEKNDTGLNDFDNVFPNHSLEQSEESSEPEESIHHGTRDTENDGSSNLEQDGLLNRDPKLPFVAHKLAFSLAEKHHENIKETAEKVIFNPLTIANKETEYFRKSDDTTKLDVTNTQETIYIAKDKKSSPSNEGLLTININEFLSSKEPHKHSTRSSKPVQTFEHSELLMHEASPEDELLSMVTEEDQEKLDYVQSRENEMNPLSENTPILLGESGFTGDLTVPIIEKSQKKLPSVLRGGYYPLPSFPYASRLTEYEPPSPTEEEEEGTVGSEEDEEGDLKDDTSDLTYAYRTALPQPPRAHGFHEDVPGPRYPSMYYPSPYGDEGLYWRGAHAPY